MGVSFKSENVQHKQALRVNTLKIRDEDLIKRLKKKKVKLEKIDFLKHGYFFEADFSLASTQEYLQGYFYIQDASSQIPVEALDPKPKETVLDMTAAPGGKCSYMAQLMNCEGAIFALEDNRSRIQSLINNLERLSITNVIVLKKDARFAHDYKKLFDKILLDAPCGGNFCVEKDYFKIRTQRDLEVKSRVQKELLRSAYLSLIVGGTLVYSTCSLEVEENEFVIDWFIQEFPDMHIEDMNLNVGDEGVTKFYDKELNKDLKKTRRMWPHKTKTDGFFIAKFKKWK